MQWIALLALAVSTILNAVYFLRTVVYLFIPKEHIEDSNKSVSHGDHAINAEQAKNNEIEKSEKLLLLPGMHCPRYVIGITALVLLNFLLGLCSGPIIDIIEQGLEVFE